MGLVNRVVEPDQLEETAFSLAAEIGANSPLSLSGNKRIIRTLRDYEGKLPDDVERELVDLRESCFRTDDFREGISAFGEKRKPDWKGR
jgi:enoyl-CoA hydratase